MSSKINLQTCEYARKSSIFQDNQLICNKYRDKIKKQAQNTYYRITNKVNDRLVHNSCDFKLLEQAYIDFCNEHNIPIDKNKVN